MDVKQSQRLSESPDIVFTGSLNTRIYKTDIQFCAVLGSWGCREKKNLNCHKYATFDVSFLYVFIAFFLNIVVSALKSYKFWQVFYFGLKQAKYFF